MMYKRGFTVFFAVLVASLALTVGIALYDLLVRELALSQTASQSQYAIYAADTGAECALYWDIEYYKTYDPSTPGHSAFATSTESKSYAAAANQAFCNGQDIVAANAYITNTPETSGAGWYINDVPAEQPQATTTFWISMGTGTKDPCAKVEVGKHGDPAQTIIVSHGYNTCTTSGGLVQLERALQINY